MTTSHPLVDQLRFTRAEFVRGIRGVPATDAVVRLGPMNCIAWNVGHLAWQEQRSFLSIPQDLLPRPDVAAEFAWGAPGTTPPLRTALAAWREITAAADPFLDTLTSEDLGAFPTWRDRTLATSLGNRLQRVIYHYWFHNGENQAIRQQLGHGRLPQFVGDIDTRAPYRPDGA